MVWLGNLSLLQPPFLEHEEHLLITLTSPDLVIAGLLASVIGIVVFFIVRRNISGLVTENASLQNEISRLTADKRAVEQANDRLVADKNELSRLEREAVIRNERLSSELHAVSARSQQIQTELTEQNTVLNAVRDAKAIADKKNAELESTLFQKERAFEKHLLLKEEQLVELKEKVSELTNELKAAKETSANISSQYAALTSTLEEKTRGFEQQEKRLETQEKHIRQEFENLANRIFETKGKTFNEQSRQTINDLLSPFRTQLTEFKQKVEDIHVKEIQQQASLSKELFDLKALNQAMTEQAHSLATALQGQKKTQGNWGELILENILDRAGLVAGRDYKREASFTTEEGRSRPDAIVYLPQEKHLIIDAKVSLNAYTRFINSEDETERAVALKEHVSAFSARIKELSDRNYYQIAELNSPEMVFMFVPIESAFVEALKADEGLFQSALEKNVLVATPTTLLTSLNIVKSLWRFEDQNKHTAEIAERAGKIYEKLNTFIGSMLAIGKQLDKAKEHYDKAFSQLYAGRGNLVKQVSDFKKLGVSVKTDLPKDIVDKADMELDLIKVEAEIEAHPDDQKDDFSASDGSTQDEQTPIEAVDEK